MARREKSGGGAEDPAWLVTFSDLMTLLLTFFVLLLSMAVIDEQAKRVVLGSITKSFGVGANLFNPLADSQTQTRIEPGPMEGSQSDLAAVRDMLFDETDKDLNFQENKYVQIVSISDEVLFVPGGTALSQRGEALLDKLVPFLQRIEYPLLVAGHTASRRDEEAGDEYKVSFDQTSMDSTWSLSFRRSLSVYRFLQSRGIEPGRLSLEAFGQFHPRYSNNSPEGRKKNRRVDLVLDKRNMAWIEKVEALKEENPAVNDVFYKGFKFEFNLPDMPFGGSEDSPARRPTGWGDR